MIAVLETTHAVSSAHLVFMPELTWIPLLPLLSFVLLILAGRRIGRFSSWLTVGSLAGACGITLAIRDAVFHGQRLVVTGPWLAASSAWTLGLSVDKLSWIMLFVVTSIATMIATYSHGYMHGDPRFSRFFAYFSLFCSSMLTLVMADHFALLYVGWELVGLCSYLLISFWFEKPAAAAAGRKAFITTRIGDTGLLVGILLLFWSAGGELHFANLEAIRASLPAGLLTLISTLIFLGAVGKSAQVPLHVWLPDAMEGPTPVSALIHAATMVAAGVYLVARTLPLFTPESLQMVLVVGLVTHLFAGTVALAMTDIKRILAYSTVSQLGLMMTALGLGAMSAAMFHLLTHAFFKALLFLGAGSVIHATHQQELSHLGALRRQMPWTAALFLIASLSMGGFVFLSGFWSKDAILLAARHVRPWVMWLLLGGASMTASYVFRLYLRCFHGAAPPHSEHRSGHGHEAHTHESPLVMVAPMAVLAIGAAGIGLFGASWFEIHKGLDVPMVCYSTLALALGVGLAWVVGLQRRNLLPESLRPFGSWLYTLAVNKYYVDELYERAVIAPFLTLVEWLASFDRRIIDGAVDAAGQAGWSVGQWKERFDRLVVDRLVNGTALTVRGVGEVVRWVQTGIIQQYLLIVVVAVGVLAALVRR